jgi:flagellar hook-length control protein FliK
MRRFLDEASLRTSAREHTAAVQAPVQLTKETFKDLAASITREYNLRENVFQQAVAAIEEAGQAKSQIRIHLKPESLGSLEVALSMEGGKLTARLIASSDEVRDVFAANLAQFKQTLESQGLAVNQLSVAVRADAQGQPQQQWQAPQQPLWQAAHDEAPQVQNPLPLFNSAGGFEDSSSTFNALA